MDKRNNFVDGVFLFYFLIFFIFCFQLYSPLYFIAIILALDIKHFFVFTIFLH